MYVCVSMYRNTLTIYKYGWYTVYKNTIYIYIDDNDTSNVIRCIQLMYIWRSMQIRIELVPL